MGGRAWRCGWALGVIFASVAAAGCADRDSDESYVPSPTVPAPSRVVEGVPKAALEVAKKPKPAPRDPALATYGKKLAQILRDRVAAQRTFDREIHDAGKDVKEKGFAALLPPYEKYDRALERTVSRLKTLKPPPAVRPIHEAVSTACDQLALNLNEMIGAMHSDGGDAAVEINKDRKKIELSGTQAIRAAFEGTGFDQAEFDAHGVFLRKG